MQSAYISYEGVSRMQAAGPGPTSPSSLLSSPLLACDEIFIVPGPGLRDTRAHAKPYRSTVPRIFHAGAGASNKSPQKREKVVGPRAEAPATAGRRDEAYGPIERDRFFRLAGAGRSILSARRRDWMMVDVLKEKGEKREKEGKGGENKNRKDKGGGARSASVIGGSRNDRVFSIGSDEKSPRKISRYSVQIRCSLYE